MPSRNRRSGRVSLPQLLRFALLRPLLQVFVIGSRVRVLGFRRFKIDLFT